MAAIALLSLLSGCVPAPEPVATPTPTPSVTPSPTPTPTPEPEPLLGATGVSAGHPRAAEAGLRMLDAGGNAVDAAVAAAFADAVAQPDASGIGGGGAAIVLVDGEVESFDYREVVNQSGVIPPTGTGIPGYTAGLALMHEQHGLLEWSALLQPAIEIAEGGIEVTPHFQRQLAFLPTGPGVTPQFYGPNGRLTAGEVLVQAELGATLRIIAAGGADAVSQGELAPAITAVTGVDPGSLAGYAVQRSTPPSGTVGAYEVVSASPPLPGAGLIQMLQIAEGLGIAATAPGSAEFIDLQTRGWRAASDAVETVFGDPDFVDVPTDALTDAEANGVAPAALEGATGLSDDTGGAGNTTHISVVDGEGNAVSMTNTITSFFGSGTYVRGFFMNDQLERFGDIGRTGANTPSPGRRSVSWSTPTMVLDDEGRVALVVGSPGGRQIPNTLASVITLWGLHGLPLDQAVSAPRFQLLGNGALQLESDAAAGALRAAGYPVQVVTTSGLYGSAQALAVDWDAGTITGHADTRRAAGFVLGTAPGPLPE